VSMSLPSTGKVMVSLTMVRRRSLNTSWFRPVVLVVLGSLVAEELTLPPESLSTVGPPPPPQPPRSKLVAKTNITENLVKNDKVCALIFLTVYPVIYSTTKFMLQNCTISGYLFKMVQTDYLPSATFYSVLDLEVVRCKILFCT